LHQNLFFFCCCVYLTFCVMLWIVIVWTWTVQSNILDGSWFKWINCEEICS
jgi:hypothetical protein